MTLNCLHHVNILSRNMTKTAAFYERLGFKIGPRPSGFPEPGIWLYIDDHPALHINPAKAMATSDSQYRRTVDHFGFAVKGSVKEVTDKLNGLGITYDLWNPIPGVCRALYFEDPTTGAKIEYVLVDEFVAPTVEKKITAQLPE
jgi:catechol 2,3-dioxygenase-like lactoylglutathione lyase family enzyme